MAVRMRLSAVCGLALVMAASAQLRVPFPRGASMATFGTVVWADGLTGRQPWRAAAEFGDTVRWGLALAGTDYYDDMDNFSGRSIAHGTAGGWFHHRRFTIKASYEYFSALELYGEHVGFMSVGVNLFRYMALSIETRAMYAVLRGRTDERESVVEVGTTLWVPLRYTAFSFAVEHITVEDASWGGFRVEPRMRLGLHSRRHRWGAIGMVGDIVVREKALFRFGVGQELWIHPMVGIAAGLWSEPLMFGVGATFLWRRWGTNISLVHHPVLGWSRGFEAEWGWRRKDG